MDEKHLWFTDATTTNGVIMATEEPWLTEKQRVFLKLWAKYFLRFAAIVGSIAFVMISLTCLWGPGGFVAGLLLVAISFISFMLAHDEYNRKKWKD